MRHSVWPFLALILLLSGCGLLRGSQVGLDNQIIVGEKFRPHKAQTSLTLISLGEDGKIARSSSGVLQPHKIVTVEAIGGTQTAVTQFGIAQEGMIVVSQRQSPNQVIYLLIEKSRYLKVRWWSGG